MLEHALSRAGDRVDALARLEELRRALDVPTARLRVDVGPAGERLAAASQGAALVVVGGANGQADRIAFGGSEVICGVRDWADVATATVANRFADALGLPLLLMHILPAAAGHGEAPSVGLERPWDHETAYRLLELVANAVGGTPSLRVEPGSAGRRLAHEATAREAGLLVVGAPTRGRLGAALTGSVSAHLMRRSQRPLVICRGASVAGMPQAF